MAEYLGPVWVVNAVCEQIINSVGEAKQEGTLRNVSVG